MREEEEEGEAGEDWDDGDDGDVSGEERRKREIWSRTSLMRELGVKRNVLVRGIVSTITCNFKNEESMIYFFFIFIF